jgi:signal transduction histidine kinase
MSFASKDQWVAVTIDRHRVGLLNAKSGDLLTTLTSPALHPVAGIRLGHDQRRLVVGTFNNLAQVWDLTALRESLKPLGCELADPLPNAASPPRLENSHRFSLATIVGSGILVSSGLGILTLAVLRWNRRLAEEFVRTESQAFEQQRELELQRELNRLKSNFVSMVSHEFRTPLGVIQSSAEILEAYLDRLGPERRAEHLAEIVQSTTRMKDLMEEVLLLSRVDSGRMEFRPEMVDLVVLARRLVTEAETAARNQCPVELVTGGMEGAQKVDEALIGIILSNLLSNALKYSRDNSPVQLLLRRDARFLTFEVRDRGLGIPASDQAQLFNSFHRASNVSHLPGTGLGLTIVKRCVELHGGTISFASTEGQGSSFIVRLPISDTR